MSETMYIRSNNYLTYFTLLGFAREGLKLQTIDIYINVQNLNLVELQKLCSFDDPNEPKQRKMITYVSVR